VDPSTSTSTSSCSIKVLLQQLHTGTQNSKHRDAFHICNATYASAGSMLCAGTGVL
jgi:hypothetical protein